MFQGRLLFELGFIVPEASNTLFSRLSFTHNGRAEARALQRRGIMRRVDRSSQSPYKILHPAEAAGVPQGCCALAVMAKAPRPGKVKTRLSPPLTPEQAAALNICFIRDTTENIAQAASGSNCAGVVSYTPVGDESAFDGLLPPAFALVAQRGDGFGERLFAAAEDLMACGYSAVCLIDSDSPTLPHGALTDAVARLEEPGDRVVVGGSQDGGYYLIGLKRLHHRLFEQIDWSTERVLQQTLERAAQIGLAVALLPTWYDVDDATTLAQLRLELDGKGMVGGYDAQHTREFIRGLPAW